MPQASWEQGSLAHSPVQSGIEQLLMGPLWRPGHLIHTAHTGNFGTLPQRETSHGAALISTQAPFPLQWNVESLAWAAGWISCGLGTDLQRHAPPVWAGISHGLSAIRGNGPWCGTSIATPCSTFMRRTEAGDSTQLHKMVLWVIGAGHETGERCHPYCRSWIGRRSPEIAPGTFPPLTLMPVFIPHPLAPCIPSVWPQTKPWCPGASSLSASSITTRMPISKVAAGLVTSVVPLEPQGFSLVSQVPRSVVSTLKALLATSMKRFPAPEACRALTPQEEQGAEMQVLASPDLKEAPLTQATASSSPEEASWDLHLWCPPMLCKPTRTSSSRWPPT
nr:uncharacterized protein LOC106732837 [Pelodiscus sinensis]|eukprot:XP_014435216.1 uncharacterized protein LOC106732837 [Pelodiscus sinensis]